MKKDKFRVELHKTLIQVSQVANRVYPIILPQDTIKDAIVYRIIGEYEATGVCGVSQFSDLAVQVDIYATTYAKSVEIAEECRRLLKANPIFTIGQLNNYEMYAEYTLKYVQVLDFMVKSYQPTPPTPIPNFIQVVNNGIMVVNNRAGVINGYI